jgi:hypothetical protein
VQFLPVEERILDLLGVLLQPLVGAKARARRTAQLATDGFLLFHHLLHALTYKVVVILKPGQG